MTRYYNPLRDKILLRLFLLLFILVGILYLEIETTKELYKKYNINISDGDILIKCNNGVYDVYNPKRLKLLCGFVPPSPKKNHLYNYYNKKEKRWQTNNKIFKD